MHPEIISICLFFFVTAFTPGPNNIVASYSGFNFGVIKTVPHILGVTLGFTALIISLIVGLINIFKLYPLIQEVLKYLINFSFVANFLKNLPTKVHEVILVIEKSKARIIT